MRYPLFSGTKAAALWIVALIVVLGVVVYLIH
jgi:hypothetical protein